MTRKGYQLSLITSGGKGGREGVHHTAEVQKTQINQMRRLLHVDLMDSNAKWPHAIIRKFIFASSEHARYLGN